MIPSFSKAGSHVSSTLVSDTSPTWKFVGCPGTTNGASVDSLIDMIWNKQKFTTVYLVKVLEKAFTLVTTGLGQLQGENVLPFLSHTIQTYPITKLTLLHFWLPNNKDFQMLNIFGKLKTTWQQSAKLTLLYCYVAHRTLKTDIFFNS